MTPLPRSCEWWAERFREAEGALDYTTTQDAEPVDYRTFYATVREIRRDLGIVTFLSVVAVIVSALALVAVFR